MPINVSSGAAAEKWWKRQYLHVLPAVRSRTARLHPLLGFQPHGLRHSLSEQTNPQTRAVRLTPPQPPRGAWPQHPAFLEYCLTLQVELQDLLGLWEERPLSLVTEVSLDFSLSLALSNQYPTWTLQTSSSWISNQVREYSQKFR